MTKNGQLYDVGMASNDPIPYHARLAKTLHGPTLALVLTYLEIHHSTPQDSPDGRQTLANGPVIIDCDLVCADLGISRRTLHIALSCLGAWWKNEFERSRAARSGREFLNERHSLKPTGHDPVKSYSVTGSKAYAFPRTLTIRRNPAKLANLMQIASIEHFNVPCSAFPATGATVLSVSNLPHILQSVLPNWQDRRSDRWERWRRENGKKSRNPGRMRGAKDVREMLESSSNLYMSESGTGC